VQPAHTVSTLRVRAGNVSITDGPFVETKEQLGGFYLLEAADADDALRLAARIPSAPLATIEVWPVKELARLFPRESAGRAAPESREHNAFVTRAG
jgi:hypothetical protein